MGKCKSIIRELRFVIEDDLTQCYVFVEAVGDCPLGVQGWHHKTFSAKVPITKILEADFDDYILWAQEAPA